MKRFKWIVEFEVDEKWVEDGFELTQERAETMLEDALPFSYEHERHVRIVKAPKPLDIHNISNSELQTSHNHHYVNL